MLFETLCALSAVKSHEFVLACAVVFLMTIAGSETSPNSRKKMTKFKNINHFRKRKNDTTPFPKRPEKIQNIHFIKVCH